MSVELHFWMGLNNHSSGKSIQLLVFLSAENLFCKPSDIKLSNIGQLRIYAELYKSMH